MHITKHAGGYGLAVVEVVNARLRKLYVVNGASAAVEVFGVAGAALVEDSAAAVAVSDVASSSAAAFASLAYEVQGGAAVTAEIEDSAADVVVSGVQMLRVA